LVWNRESWPRMGGGLPAGSDNHRHSGCAAVRIAYTFLTNQEDPFTKEAAEIMFLCGERKLTGYLAMHITAYFGAKVNKR